MIPGVEILNTNPYVMARTWGWDWAAAFVAIGAICLIIMVIIFIYIKDRVLAVVVGLCATVFIIFTISMFHDAPVYGTEYQCTINDDVSLTDVYNNYTIESVNGKIYTLRPIEPIPFVATLLLMLDAFKSIFLTVPVAVIFSNKP